MPSRTPLFSRARFKRALVTSTCVCLAAGAAIGFVGPAGASTAAPAPAQVRWSPSWMATDTVYSSDTAATIATRFNLIAAFSKDVGAYLPAMHAANPATRVVAYVNGTYTKSTKYPESWYAHTATGARVQWIPYGTDQLELSNPSVRDFLVSSCSTAIAQGFDGCLFDSMGLTPLHADDKSGLPIDPSTGAVYTGAAWLNLTAAVLRQARSANPGKVIAANGLGVGANYFDSSAPTSVLAGAANVAEAEQFVRSATSSVSTHKTEAVWKQDVDMMVDAQSRGTSVAAVTKVWTTATAVQLTAWHAFAYATFLLGDDGSSRFTFLSNTTTSATDDSTMEATPIGTPAGSYAKTAGVYQRAYSNGLVMVNPTKTALTVPITGRYTTLQGTVVTGTIKLAPYSGNVLTNS